MWTLSSIFKPISVVLNHSYALWFLFLPLSRENFLLIPDSYDSINSTQIISLTQWTWIWANSGRQWRTGKPGILGVANSWIGLSDWTTTIIISTPTRLSFPESGSHGWSVQVKPSIWNAISFPSHFSHPPFSSRHAVSFLWKHTAGRHDPGRLCTESKYWLERWYMNTGISFEQDFSCSFLL